MLQGGDIKKFLNFYTQGSDYYQWSNEQLAFGLNEFNGNNSLNTFLSTWNEQRNWGLYYAFDALTVNNNSNDYALLNEINSKLMRINNVINPIEDNKWIEVKNMSDIFNVISNYNNNEYEIQFDIKTGGISKLFNMNKSINYASVNNILGEFIYQTLNENDFNDGFIANYSLDASLSYIQGDFGKHELNQYANPKHQYIIPNMKQVYQNNMNKNEFLIEFDFGNYYDILRFYYGIPQYLYNKISFNSDISVFTMDLYLINKTATRIPENIFVKFNPLNINKWKVYY